MKKMISVEDALNKIIGNVNILDAEIKPILECAGQVLAEDIFSGIDIPPLDNSAMDGYAVRAADVGSAAVKSPVILKVIDTVPAGAMAKKNLTPGTAIRIMTGAPVPEGADTVVRFEDTDEEQRSKDTGEIAILNKVQKGTNVRVAGEDVAKNSLALTRGTVLKPADIGMLASLGQATAAVIRRPKVAILATGNELVEINEPLPPGKIYNSNSYSIAAEVRRYGGIPWMLGIARDSEDSLTASVRQGLQADMLITTGGVSVGDYDIVKDVLMKEGEITFWTVNMKPGKPVAFGSFPSGEKRIPHLGLPGNPVSAMIVFEMFARPCILKMEGKKKFAKPTVDAVIEDTVTNTDGRRMYTRALVEERDGRFYARTTGPQGSNILKSMSLANGLVVIPENTPGVKPGDIVKVIMLDWSYEDY
jgi:molybdopterin molybdotransferase